MEQTNRIALYLRISVEDEKCQAGLQKESNSILSQRELLEHYLDNHEEFSDYKRMEFTDDGYSGTSFERPGMQALLKQARKGRLRCIIVKDFSRLGRNYLLTGDCLEQIFPLLGVRFISVNDGYDSKKGCGAAGSLEVGFKNLLHDMYSRELSQKVTSVRRTKARQGKFITGAAPYGLRKTDGQRLAGDPDTAPVVGRIYQMFLDGAAQAHIARRLNQEQIPSPLAQRRLRGERFPCRPADKAGQWTTAAIHRILRDQRYVGDCVYGRTKPLAVGSHKEKPVPKEDWIVVPGVFEGIITRKAFERVQAMLKKPRQRESAL